MHNNFKRDDQMQVGLIGISGYGGTQLYQLLKHHPHIDNIHLYGHDLTKAKPVNQVIPGLIHESGTLVPYDANQIMAENDVVFFATSAGVTTKLAKPFLEHDFPVIDLSGDFRLKSGAMFTKWYHKQAPATAWLQQAHYGLADFSSAEQSNYIANPGCYATATLLGLAPVVMHQWIDPTSIIVDAKSGTSGAGKQLSEMTHFSNTNENLQIYKVNQHQHIPEIMQQLQCWNSDISAIQFTTTLVPLTRGLMSTIYVKVKTGISEQQVEQSFEQTFADKADIHYCHQKLPIVKQVVGTNYCDVGMVFNPVTKIITIVSVIDNLIKGAGGQAIQNLNQRFGFSLNQGLSLEPIWP